MSVTCQTESEMLALCTIVSCEWAKCIEDADELLYWGEFATSVGTNLIMMADQRIRRQNCLTKAKDKKNKSKDSDLSTINDN